MYILHSDGSMVDSKLGGGTNSTLAKVTELHQNHSDED